MRAVISRPACYAILASCAALALSACGSSNDSPAAGSTSAGTTPAATTGGGSGGTIGFSIPQGADPSLQLLDGGVKAQAAKAGLKVQTTDANLDLNKQLSDIDTFIQQKVKAIVVWPLDSKAIQPALARAKDAGIPIVAIYALSDGPYYTDLVIDGHAAGASAAQEMAKTLGKGAKVAGIFGPPQVDQFREIAEGFTAAAKTAGLDVVENQVDPKISPESAATFTQNYKQRYGASLKGMFVSYETGALAASAVAGGDFKPQIFNYGGTDASLKGLREGQLSASVYQNVVLLGRIAGWAAGQADAKATIPPKLYLELPVIAQDRAEAFPDTAAQLTKPYDFKPVEKDGKSYMPLFK
jgi:ABC-type sugar transport system substrate-binding protein